MRIMTKPTKKTPNPLRGWGLSILFLLILMSSAWAQSPPPTPSASVAPTVRAPKNPCSILDSGGAYGRLLGNKSCPCLGILPIAARVACYSHQTEVAQATALAAQQLQERTLPGGRDETFIRFNHAYPVANQRLG